MGESPTGKALATLLCSIEFKMRTNKPSIGHVFLYKAADDLVKNILKLHCFDYQEAFTGLSRQ